MKRAAAAPCSTVAAALRAFASAHPQEIAAAVAAIAQLGTARFRLAIDGAAHAALAAQLRACMGVAQIGAALEAAGYRAAPRPTLEDDAGPARAPGSP